MSIHPKKGGGFVVRWRDETGKNRQRSFDLKGDATQWDTEVRRLRQRGQLARLDGGRITFSQYVAETMVPHHFAHKAPRTQAFYRELLAAHILEPLGTTPLRSFTPRLLRGWQADRLAAGAGPRNLNRALSLISMVLQHAAEDGELESNPALLVRKVATEQADAVVPLSPATVEAIRAHLELRDRTIVTLLAYTGMRPQELYGLRWQDIGRQTIHVQRAVDGYRGLKSTKTKATRAIKTFRVVRNDVRAWKKGSPTSTAADRLVFPIGESDVAGKTAMDNWRSRQWTSALEAAGVSYQRPYDLRHSFASLLLAAGHTIHYVAQQLGHSPKLTLSTYGHVIADYEGMPPIDPDMEVRAAREAARAAGEA